MGIVRDVSHAPSSWSPEFLALADNEWNINRYDIEDDETREIVRSISEFNPTNNTFVGMYDWVFNKTYDDPPILGELRFTMQYEGVLIPPIVPESNEIPYIAMILKRAREHCGEPYSALAWTLMGFQYGFQWEEGDATDAMISARSSGLVFDQIIPFVAEGVKSIRTIARMVEMDIDPALASSISGTDAEHITP